MLFRARVVCCKSGWYLGPLPGLVLLLLRKELGSAVVGAGDAPSVQCFLLIPVAPHCLTSASCFRKFIILSGLMFLFPFPSSSLVPSCSFLLSSQWYLGRKESKHLHLVAGWCAKGRTHFQQCRAFMQRRN